MPPNPRWSDEKLEQFYQAFLEHVITERDEQTDQRALHEAVFRKEDKDAGVPPGLIQLVVRMDARLDTIERFHFKQRTFIGGVLFAITSIWFFLTDVGPDLAKWLKKLWS